MKFIILTLLLNLVFVSTAKAEERESLIYSYEELNDNNLLLINSERRFRCYMENKVYSNDYFLKGTNIEAFPYLEEGDSIVTDFSSWDHEVVLWEHEDRVIEERVVNKYRELRPVRYIFLEDFKGAFTTFRFSELRVLVDNVAINYQIDCFGCSVNFRHYITNGIINENNAFINNGGRLSIDLGDYYGINQIKIELYFYDPVPNSNKFKIYMNEGNKHDIDNYAYHEFVSFVVSQNNLQPEKHLIIPDATWITNPVYMDWVYISGFLNPTYYREMIVAVERRYKDTKYKYFNLNRDYILGYHLNCEGYLKDENQYKDYYLYQVIKEEEGEEKTYDNLNENDIEDFTEYIDESYLVTFNESDSVEEDNDLEGIKEECDENLSYKTLDIDNYYYPTGEEKEIKEEESALNCCLTKNKTLLIFFLSLVIIIIINRISQRFVG